MSTREISSIYHIQVSHQAAQSVEESELKRDLVDVGYAWVENVSQIVEKHECALQHYNAEAYLIPDAMSLNEFTHAVEHKGFRKISQSELKVFVKEIMTKNVAYGTFICNGSYWRDPQSEMPRFPVVQICCRTVTWKLVAAHEISTLTNPMMVFISRD